MPHFHLLVDASFVPHKLVCEIWNRNRPKSAGPVQGKRPGFGSVRFSAPKFANAKHAACYACKYVIKEPEYGFPEWVLDFKGKIARYDVSKGFWRKASKHVQSCDQLDSDAEGHDPTCFCEVCRGEAVKLATTSDEAKKPQKTIAQRIAECGESALLLSFEEMEQADGSKIKQWRFMKKIELPFSELAKWMGRQDAEGKFEVTSTQVRELKHWRLFANGQGQARSSWHDFEEFERRTEELEGNAKHDTSKINGSDTRRRTLHQEAVPEPDEPDRSSISSAHTVGPSSDRDRPTQVLLWPANHPVFRKPIDE